MINSSEEEEKKKKSNVEKDDTQEKKLIFIQYRGKVTEDYAQNQRASNNGDDTEEVEDSNAFFET